jgi:phage shock protein PspC (stress-responsive transcriptional regulator)
MKRLYRSKKEKMLAGVAGGLAEYFDIDPVIIRIIFVITALISGAGIIAYLLLWIIVPLNPEQLNEFYQPRYSNVPGQKDGNKETEHSAGTNTEQQSSSECSADNSNNENFKSYEAESMQDQSKGKNKNVLAGAILITLGILFLADNFLPFFRFSDFWPLVFVAIGIGLILKNK